MLYDWAFLPTFCGLLLPRFGVFWHLKRPENTHSFYVFLRSVFFIIHLMLLHWVFNSLWSLSFNGRDCFIGLKSWIKEFGTWEMQICGACMVTLGSSLDNFFSPHCILTTGVVMAICQNNFSSYNWQINISRLSLSEIGFFIVHINFFKLVFWVGFWQWKGGFFFCFINCA